MRIPRFHVPGPLNENSACVLTGTAFQHATKVLRLRVGAEIMLFDGSGIEWRGVLDTIAGDRAEVRFVSCAYPERETPLHWELVQGISRGERMDYTLQKSVELGVAAIHPVETRRSMVKLQGARADKRIDHWQGIANNACEQCGRTRLARLSPIRSLDDFLAARAGGLLLILDPEADSAVADLPEEAPERVLLLAGPEGGFDARERTAVYAAGARGLRLGPRILRTETAAVVAAALLLNRWGDLD